MPAFSIPSVQTPTAVRQKVASTGLYTAPVSIVDPANDLTWGRSYQRTAQSSDNLFDYYFAGQDIKVIVDGCEDDPNFGDIPIGFMAFQISQQKQPVWGYASYTYDAVMRGQRVVQGSFTVLTTTTDYMTRMLQYAASARSTRQGPVNILPTALTEDDRNINMFWNQNNGLDQALSYEQINIFSSHPPFDLVVLYGIQDISIDQGFTTTQNAAYEKYKNSNPLYTDMNERYVESDPVNYSNRYVLSNCELLNMSTQYDPSGNVISEAYTFLAQDILIPRGGGFGNGNVATTLV